MFLDAASAPNPEHSHAIDVRQVNSCAELDDYIAASDIAFEGQVQRAATALSCGAATLRVRMRRVLTL
jgi:hypothetical protein